MGFRSNKPLRAVVALLLAALVAPTLFAQSPPGSDPYDAAFRRVSNGLLCQCGCNYLVLSCNHVDCSSATYIRKTIRTALEAGQTEEAILASFVEQYGPKILPEPPRKGFSWMAWIMPFLALALGGGAVSYVLWRWKSGPSPQESEVTPAEAVESPQTTPEVSPELVEKYRARIDQELEKD